MTEETRRNRGSERNAPDQRIKDEETRKALQELLETAIRLHFDPRREPLGETGFSFGPRRYPLCRVNAKKGIAFHASRKAEVRIARSTDYRTFRLATGTLRRTALSAARDR